MSARDADGAAEPLIRRESEEDSSAENATAVLGRGEEDEDVTFGWFIWILTFSAGVSGLLFGYEYASSADHANTMY
jgi:SP family myo-inositol transporter-like MFS transporter 13